MKPLASCSVTLIKGTRFRRRAADVRMCFVALATLIAHEQIRLYPEPSRPTAHATVHSHDGNRRAGNQPHPPPRDSHSHSELRTPASQHTGSGTVRGNEALFASPLSSSSNGDHSNPTIVVVKSLLAAYDGNGFDFVLLSSSCPGIPATFTLSEIYSTSNCRFVVAGRISAPSLPLPAWAGETVVAKIRLGDHTDESWRK